MTVTNNQSLIIRRQKSNINEIETGFGSLTNEATVQLKTHRCFSYRKMVTSQRISQGLHISTCIPSQYRATHPEVHVSF